MGPIGKIPYRQNLENLTLNAICLRRRKAINIIKEKGVKKFAIYARTKNIVLSDKQYYRHKMCNITYLMRDEFYNNSLLAKIILEKIDSNKIIKIINLGLQGYLPDLLPNFDHYDNNNDLNKSLIIDDSENVIIGPKGAVGMKGPRGPGDDGYGGNYCGSSGPCIRQFLNDPLSLLMAIILHPDEQLLTIVINKIKKLKKYMTRAFEVFLIDGIDGIEPMKRIIKYVNVNNNNNDININNTLSYAFGFIEKYYTNELHNYKFLLPFAKSHNMNYVFPNGIVNIWY